MFSREKYLRMSIRKQIVCGMGIVSSCAGFLLLCLIAINCFCFMSKTFQKTIFLIESYEDGLLNSVISLYDFSIMIAFEKGKNEIQFLRNIKENYAQNPHIYSFITMAQASKFFKDKSEIDSSKNYDCLSNFNDCFYFYNDFSVDGTITSEMKYLFLLIPVLRESLTLDDLNKIPLFRSFQYTSISNSMTFVFPYGNNTLVNDSFGYQDNFENSKEINSFLDLTKDAYIPRFNDVAKDENFTTIFLNNPMVFINLPPFGLTLPYKRDPEVLYYIMSFCSGQDYNYMQLELQKDYYDLVTSEVIDSFPDFTVITILTLTKEKTGQNVVDYVGTASSCRYFRKLLSFFNEDTQATENFQSLHDCLNGKEFVKQFDHLFQSNYSSDYTSYFYNFIRQGIVPYEVSKDFHFLLKNLNFKIFKIFLPIKPTRAILSSNYLSSFIGTSYFFKNNASLILVERRVNILLLSLMTFVLFYTLIFWVLTLSIVSLKSLYLAKEITKPLNQLTNEISIKGKRRKEASSFKFDKDIDDLFRICNIYLKGAVGEEGKLKKKKGINCYNNISLIKTNNLIIDEKSIFRKEEEATKNIFDYGKKRRTVRSNVRANTSELKENAFNKFFCCGLAENELDLREFFEIKALGLDEKKIAQYEKNELYEKLENVIISLEV